MGCSRKKMSLNKIMKKFFIFIFCLLAFSSNAKETTFNKELFDKAQADGKVVVVSSWIKYCSSCASQMKVLNKAKNEFDNICLLYTSPSPRDATLSRMPSSA